MTVTSRPARVVRIRLCSSGVPKKTSAGPCGLFSKPVPVLTSATAALVAAVRAARASGEAIASGPGPSNNTICGFALVWIACNSGYISGCRSGVSCGSHEREANARRNALPQRSSPGPNVWTRSGPPTLEIITMPSAPSPVAVSGESNTPCVNSRRPAIASRCWMALRMPTLRSLIGGVAVLGVSARAMMRQCPSAIPNRAAWMQTAPHSTRIIERTAGFWGVGTPESYGTRAISALHIHHVEDHLP